MYVSSESYIRQPPAWGQWPKQCPSRARKPKVRSPERRLYAAPWPSSYYAERSTPDFPFRQACARAQTRERPGPPAAKSIWILPAAERSLINPRPSQTDGFHRLEAVGKPNSESQGEPARCKGAHPGRWALGFLTHSILGRTRPRIHQAVVLKNPAPGAPCS